MIRKNLLTVYILNMRLFATNRALQDLYPDSYRLLFLDLSLRQPHRFLE